MSDAGEQAIALLAQHTRSCDERYGLLREDVDEMKADIKTLVAAHNMGRGFWATVKVGGGLSATAAALASVWHFLVQGGK